MGNILSKGSFHFSLLTYTFRLSLHDFKSKFHVFWSYLKMY